MVRPYQARAKACEGLGTFALVFFGTGAIIVDQTQGGMIGHVGIAWTFGLVVMAMIFTFGPVSGAHLNPAVTLGLVAAGRFPLTKAPGYVVAQMLGALAASGVLRLLFPASVTYGATLPSGSEAQSFLLEMILTAVLMLVILQVTSKGRESTFIPAIGIGAVVGLEAMAAGPVCGASMNPARSLAPALVSGHLDHLWIYLVATVLGAWIAVPLHALVSDSAEPRRSAETESEAGCAESAGA